MKLFRCLLPVLALLLALPAARAQILVTLSLKERLYIAHEPIIATVSVTNNTGADIAFTDVPQSQWFGFRIRTSDDKFVPPRDAEYHLASLSLRAGETIKRSVNLNELYELGEFGIFSARATIYSDLLGKYFTSRPASFEVTEGHVIWKKTAGVPEGQPDAGQTRVFSLLTHQRGETNLIYVRVQDAKTGDVYCTYPLARLMEGTTPQTEFDAGNNLYVLQLIGQKQYILSKVSPNGKFLGQTNYTVEKYRPNFRKLPSGELLLVGAHREERPLPGAATPPPVPKLSDRPVALPTAN